MMATSIDPQNPPPVQRLPLVPCTSKESALVKLIVFSALALVATAFILLHSKSYITLPMLPPVNYLHTLIAFSLIGSVLVISAFSLGILRGKTLKVSIEGPQPHVSRKCNIKC